MAPSQINFAGLMFASSFGRLLFVSANRKSLKLENLLRETVAEATQREKTEFDRLAGGTKPIVLFGAGGLGRRTLAGLRKYGVRPVAFADNSSAAWGRDIEGVPVLSPKDAAAKFGKNGIFVVTIWGAFGKDRMRDRINQVRQLGCDNVVSFGPLYWKYPDGLVPHYSVELPHKVLEEKDRIREAYALWADDASREEFLAHLQWRLKMDFDVLAQPMKHPIYFPHDLLQLSDEEVFVDCGAFDGDSAKLFINECGGKYRKIVAFEPDPMNFAKLQENAKTWPGGPGKTLLMQAATGAQRGKIRMMAAGNKSSAVGQGDVEVDLLTLDESLKGLAPTYLKMDIEGAEMDTLEGAANVIRDHAPVLTISAYHRQNDLWNIPLLIRSLNSSYRFYLRPHDLEVWDTVCYAIPAKRLKHS